MSDNAEDTRPTHIQKSGRRRACLLPIFATLCLMAFLLFVASIALPAQAEVVYGPPGRNFDPLQRTLLAARLLSSTGQLRQPFQPGGEAQNFAIEHGESTYQITERLEGAGLIASASALRDYLVYGALDTTLQAGEFTLNPHMTAIEIAYALQDATPGEVTFQVLPGWRMEEIAAALPTSGLTFTSEEFLAYTKNPPPGLLNGDAPANATLEGFLFPDSYLVPREISLGDFIATLFENFAIKVNLELRQGFANQGLSLYQAVTLASIVEREAILTEEMPIIASVFYNRLESGMNLDSDPTVQYALGYNLSQATWWTNPLSLTDLQIDSPYNTYIYPGLPPAPIANPGLLALQAVAAAQQTPYLYFRAACDDSGRHVFSETYEQHQQNACP